MSKTAVLKVAIVGDPSSAVKGFNQTESAASRWGSGIKTTAKLVGGALGAIVTTSLVSGFKRLSAIEQAQAKLSGLGHSGTAVKTIMNDALTAVKGTAFGMDEAASVAASAVAAGIKPGKELQSVLRLNADAATIAGSSFGEMGAIFGKVAASNKLQGDSIAQLQDRGIPILQLVAKQMGVTTEEAAKMASKGKVNFDIFRKAMESGLGGAAQKAGNTTTGAFKNMMAAQSRFGASLLKELYPLAVPVLNKITELFDKGADSGGKFMTWTANKAKELGAAFQKLDFTSWDGFWKSLNAQGGSSASILSGLRDNFVKLAPAGQAFADNLPKIGGAIGTLAGAGLNVLNGALGFLSDNVDTIVQWMPAIITGLAAWKVGSMVLGAAQHNLVAAQTAMIPVTTVNNVLRLAAIRGEKQLAAMTATSTAAKRTSAATTAASVAATTASTVATGRLTVAQRLQTVVQRGLNAVMKANPIMLIITAIFMLIEGFKWAYENVGWFRDGVNAAWKGIQDFVRPIIDWFVANVGPILAKVWEGIAAGAKWLWETIIVPAFQWGQENIAPVVAWIVANVGPFIGKTFEVLGAVAKWLWETIIVPAFQWGQENIAPVVAWIVANVGPFIGKSFEVLGAVAKWLWENVIVPGFKWGQQNIKPVIDWIVNVGIPAGKKSFEVLGQAANWLWRNVIVPAWNGISGIVRGVMSAIQNSIKFATQIFTGDWRGAMNTLNSATGGGVGKVLGWIRGIPSGISNALGNLGNLLWSHGSAVLNGFLNGLQSAWSGVTNFVGGIADWISAHKGPISYDWHLLEPHGKAILGGLVNSMKKSMPLLKSMVKNITGTIQSVGDTAPEVNLGITGSGTLGAAGTVISIRVDGALDPTAVGKQLEAILLDVMRRTGRRANGQAL